MVRLILCVSSVVRSCVCGQAEMAAQMVKSLEDRETQLIERVRQAQVRHFISPLDSIPGTLVQCSMRGSRAILVWSTHTSLHLAEFMLTRSAQPCSSLDQIE